MMIIMPLRCDCIEEEDTAKLCRVNRERAVLHDHLRVALRLQQSPLAWTYRDIPHMWVPEMKDARELLASADLPSPSPCGHYVLTILVLRFQVPDFEQRTNVSKTSRDHLLI